MLESGLHRAQNAFLYGRTGDVVELGAELLYGIAKAHAFIQGNKRTAFQGMTMFLMMNGVEIMGEELIDQALLEDRIIELITDAISVEDFAAYLSPMIVGFDDAEQ